MEHLRIIEIPEPIGTHFCHRHNNGTIEHHETRWQHGFAKCEVCGLVAEVSEKPLDQFLNDEVLMQKLTGS